MPFTRGQDEMLRQMLNLHQSVIACYERLASFYAYRTREVIRDDYLAPLLALPTGARILDVGCGTGHDIQSLAAEGYHVTGVDISPAMCRVARNLTSRFADVEIIEGDSGVWDHGDLRFDAVLSSMEIFHHEDLKETLKKYAEYLAPEGLFVLVTNHPVRNVLVNPDWDYFSEDWTWEDWGEHGHIPKHHWSLRHYLDSLAAVGFRNPQVREYAATPDLRATQDANITCRHPYPSLLAFIARKEFTNGR